MKLGSQTGSFINHIQSLATAGQPEPTVGMGCTILHWTDRSAATITRVDQLHNSKKYSYAITVARDDVKLVSGSQFDEVQEYAYTPSQTSGTTQFCFERSTNSWVQMDFNGNTNRLVKSKSSNGLRIGERDHYRDPSF